MPWHAGSLTLQPAFTKDFGRGCSAAARAAAAAVRLDGPWMRAFTLYNLHTTFGFDSKVEQELQPGITISKAVSTMLCTPAFECVLKGVVAKHCCIT
jgi:hypothetical protein